MDYGTYCPVDVLKAELDETLATNDARLLRVLERASRRIDDHCHRHFYTKTATRTFTARRSGELLLPYDLLSIVTLKTDEDGDWDFDQTWATTDYHLYPFNDWPKWKILTKSGGSYCFPGQLEGVQITGIWGYGDGQSASPWRASGATVTVADETSTEISVSDQSKLAVGQTLLVEAEQMYVTALADAAEGDTATVVRGVNGTTAAAHDAKPASIAVYPEPIVNACVRTAARIYRLQSAPFGVTGGADMGTQEVPTRFDMDIFQDLAPYRHFEVG
jgi:hypothetical protein